MTKSQHTNDQTHSIIKEALKEEIHSIIKERLKETGLKLSKKDYNKHFNLTKNSSTMELIRGAKDKLDEFTKEGYIKKLKNAMKVTLKKSEDRIRKNTREVFKEGKDKCRTQKEYIGRLKAIIKSLTNDHDIEGLTSKELEDIIINYEVNIFFKGTKKLEDMIIKHIEGVDVDVDDMIKQVKSSIKLIEERL